MIVKAFVKLLIGLCCALSYCYSQSIELCEAAAAEGIYAGSDGWILSEGDFVAEFDFASVEDYLLQLDAQLKEQSIQLVMVVVPPRGMLYSSQLDSLPPNYDPALAADAFHTFIAALNDLGLIAFDALSVLETAENKEELFFKRDHHWTPRGAQIVAQGLAKRIAEVYPLNDLVKNEFVTEIVDEQSENSSSQGRILKESCGITPPPEYFARPVTSKKSSDLLGEEAPPEVVLVGTSYSYRGEESWRYNFDGFIKEALQIDVLNYGISAGGPFTSLQDYLLSDTYKTQPPKLLIWEIAGAHSRLFNDPLAFRQVIPAVSDDCSSDNALANYDISLSGEQTVSIEPDVVLPNNFVLSLTSVEKLTTFDLHLEYASGDKEEVKLDRSKRMENGEVFVMSFENEAELQSLTISFPEPKTQALSVALCSTSE